jgi:cytochrome c oxidase assembly factor 6
MKTPNSRQRSECWKSRDEYFECLDSNELFLYNLSPVDYQEILNLDPLNLPAHSDRRGKCFKEYQGFKGKCLASWVKHFEMLRVKELQEKALKEKVELDLQRKDTDPFWEKVQKAKNA